MSRFLFRAAALSAALVVALLGNGPAARAADPPSMLRDIDQTAAGSDPSWIVDVGGKAFVFGCDSSANLVLWTSDGTPLGSSRVGSLEFGPCEDSWPEGAVSWNGQLWFLMGDTLWSSDGSTATGLISGFFRPWNLMVAGSRLFFTEANRTLWTSDGTAEGTYMLREIDVDWPTPVVMGGKLYFGHNGSLWVSDGTTTGTHLLVDPIAGRSWLEQLAVVGNKVFFIANPSDVETGSLYVSDGTAAGTHQVKNVDPTRSDNVTNLTAAGNRLYFVTRDATHGYELWRSDGTDAGTKMVRDIRPGAAGSKPEELIAEGTRVFFSATDGVNGRHLWVSNGTKAGTLDLGKHVPWQYLDYSVSAAVIGTTLYFPSATNGDVELWKSDGTAPGTARVADINPSGSSEPDVLTVVGGKLFFSADESSHGRELWVSNGTAAGTSLAADLNMGTNGSRPDSLTRTGSKVFFVASDGVHGTEPWVTDGTPSGTRMILDIRPGTLSSTWGDWMDDTSTSAMVGFGSDVLFVANDGVVGYQVWRSDGTAAGTHRITDLAFEVFPDSVDFTPFGSTVLFKAAETSGTSLWITDGTTAGTLRLHKPSSAVTYEDIAQVAVAGSRAYFLAATEVGEYPYVDAHTYLWTTDGTKAGTHKVPFDFGYNPPQWMTAIGSTLYFTRYATNNHMALWKSDGTAAGTVMVKKLPNETGDYGPGPIVNRGGKLFFWSDRYDSEGNSIGQLWTSDGTADGTVLLQEGSGEHRSMDFVKVGSNVLFTAGEPGEWWLDLWTTDGTPEGTICLHEGYGMDPASLRVIGGVAWFSAWRDGEGRELWRSDGSVGGTYAVAQLNPDDGSDGNSSPGEFTRLGDQILFIANDGQHGAELWSMPMP